MTPQKAALEKIKATGSVEGINRRTVEALEKRGSIKATAEGWTLTKRGESRLAGRLGNTANLARMWDRKEREHALKGATRGGKRTKATRKDTAAHRRAAEKEIAGSHQEEKKALAAVLGPHGIAHAVKVAKTNGEPFTFQDVDAFEENGWRVEGAASVAAKPGSGKLPGDGDLYLNPAPLGPGGTARALILLGHVDRAAVGALRRYGLDISAAPKRYREGTTRNPKPGALEGMAKKVYQIVRAASEKNQAWNADEIGNKAGTDAEPFLDELEKLGFIHSPGRDMFGPVYVAGVAQAGLFANPSARTRAAKKAAAFYDNPNLTTEPKALKGYTAPESFVDIGDAVALEYRSNKFDGKTRVYRHDITKKRKFLISADGSTIVIWPPLKVTKRGIEG